jgi:hypothetical protein
MPTEELPTWDDDQARGLIGKTVLLGLTFATADGDVVEQVQRHGIVEHADPEKGIGVRLIGPGQVWDGELYELPPDLRPFSEAAPGSYRLRSTGETIVDPDFTSTWEIRSPPEEDDTPERREARLREAQRFGFIADEEAPQAGA